MAEYGRAANQEAEDAGFDFIGFLWRRFWLALFSARSVQELRTTTISSSR